MCDVIYVRPDFSFPYFCICDYFFAIRIIRVLSREKLDDAIAKERTRATQKTV